MPCRAVLATMLVLALPWAAAAAPPARASKPKVLVPDVEVVDLAPPDQQYDQKQDAARAAMLTRRLRAALSKAHGYRLLDRGPADRKPPYSYHSCRACMAGWARKRGADLVLVTWVQKESRLILFVSMALIDVHHPDRPARGGSIALRNDIGAMWRAGASQLLQRTMGVEMTP